MNTEIVYILDRSGSMTGNWAEAMGSLRTFIKEQQENTDPCKFTLIGFDNLFDIFIDAKELTEIDAYNLPVFEPRGMTALYDSIGKAVTLIKERINNTPEQNKPEKVLFVIVTDGAENASQEYTKKSITEMIKTQEAVSWEFMYIGAGLDIMQEGMQLGMKQTNLYSTFDKSGRSFDAISNYTSNTIASYRSSK